MPYTQQQANTKPTYFSKCELAPGEMLAVDVVGKLPRSHDGKFFILTIVYHYSRFLVTILLANVTSHSIIKILNDYFSRFGIAKVIFSDNTLNFKSDEFDYFLKSLNIKHRHSSIYYPR